MTLACTAPQQPTDGNTEDLDPRVRLLRRVRRRLESMMRPELDLALSVLLDEILQMEESVAGEESLP